MKSVLPGPFTFILNTTNEVAKSFETKRTELGIRSPDNKIVLALVEALGNPIATTSLYDEEDTMMEYFVDPYKIYEQFDEQVNTIIDVCFFKEKTAYEVDG